MASPSAMPAMIRTNAMPSIERPETTSPETLVVVEAASVVARRKAPAMATKSDPIIAHAAGPFSPAAIFSDATQGRMMSKRLWATATSPAKKLFGLKVPNGSTSRKTHTAE